VADPCFITRVILRNYKSIAAVDVSLSRQIWLVGPNGSGKSNFLDSLRFVADALNHTLDHALRDRGGINDVRRRSSGHPTHFSIKLFFQDDKNGSGSYYFRIGSRRQGGFEVQSEECQLNGFFKDDVNYRVEKGNVVSATPLSPPAAVSDRLYLVNISGHPEFRWLYESLSNMGFYNLNPDRIRDLQSPDSGELLQRDGNNIASVVRQLDKYPAIKQRIEDFLSQVVPGIDGVDVKNVGPKETLEFRQKIQGAANPWRFLAANMSDGTLRTLGILVALFQGKKNNGTRARLVGIEEPEVALHPAAAGILRDALNDASKNTQIIVTSHSPDLLDDYGVSAEHIRAVISEGGVTRIALLDEAGKTAINDRLYTPGELLRLNQLTPKNQQEISGDVGSDKDGEEV